MLLGLGYSAGKVAWIAGVTSTVTTLAQSAMQGTLSPSPGIVIPVAVAAGALSGVLGYVVQQSRMREWQRIHEKIIETQKTETDSTFASVRTDMNSSLAGVRLEMKEGNSKLDQRISDLAHDQREDFRTLTSTMADVKEALMQTAIRRRSNDAD